KGREPGGAGGRQPELAAGPLRGRVVGLLGRDALVVGEAAGLRGTGSRTGSRRQPLRQGGVGAPEGAGDAPRPGGPTALEMAPGARAVRTRLGCRRRAAAVPDDRLAHG